MGIMEKKIETTSLGLGRVRATGFVACSWFVGFRAPVLADAGKRS